MTLNKKSRTEVGKHYRRERVERHNQNSHQAPLGLKNLTQ